MNLTPTQRHWIETWVNTCPVDFAQFSLEAFLDCIRPTYPLPIHFCRLPLEKPYPVGLCTVQNGTAYLMVGQHPDLHPTLEEFIGLHEIAHLVLRHPLQIVEPERPNISLRKLGSPLKKASPQEYEAEYFALVVSQRIYAAHPTPARLAPFEIIPRLVAAFAFED